MSTDVGYGISSKFRIDDSDLGKVERRLTGIAKSISGIKTSLVDALYGREVRSALDQLERRVSGVMGKAARAGRAGGMGGGIGAAGGGMGGGIGAAGGMGFAAGTNALVRVGGAPFGWSPFGRAQRMIGQDADFVGGFGFGGGGRGRGPFPWSWDSPLGSSNMAVWGGGGGVPPRRPAYRQIGGPAGPIPQYGSWNAGWAGFGHPAAGGGGGARAAAQAPPIDAAYVGGGGIGPGAFMAGGAVLAYGAARAAGAALDSQRDAESGRQGITAAMSAFGNVPIDAAQARSASVYRKLEKAAAVGPGETSDYAFAFQRIFGPLSQRGATDEQMMKLVSQSIAGGSMLWGSAGAKFGPMDIMQALTSGLTDRTTPLAAMAVQSAGYSKQEFAKADGARQVDMLIEGFSKLEPAIAIFANTVDAQEHTFSDAMGRLIRNLSGPAFELYRQNLLVVNTALADLTSQTNKETDAARELVTALAVVVDHGLGGFMTGLRSTSDTMAASGSEFATSMTSSADLIYIAANGIGLALGAVAGGLTLLASIPGRAVGVVKDQVAGGYQVGNRVNPITTSYAIADYFFGPNHGGKFRMEGEEASFNMVSNTPGAFDMDPASAAKQAADQARAAAKAAGGGKGPREITIRIADFKVDITEPRAIARSYKRVVSDALTQMARSGVDTAVDGVVL